MPDAKEVGLAALAADTKCCNDLVALSTVAALPPKIRRSVGVRGSLTIPEMARRAEKAAAQAAASNWASRPVQGSRSRSISDQSSAGVPVIDLAGVSDSDSATDQEASHQGSRRQTRLSVINLQGASINFR